MWWIAALLMASQGAAEGITSMPIALQDAVDMLPHFLQVFAQFYLNF
jgi:hypothetical protein